MAQAVLGLTGTSTSLGKAGCILGEVGRVNSGPEPQYTEAHSISLDEMLPALQVTLQTGYL